MSSVVVTGIGAVTPFGLGVDALWEGVRDGRPALGALTRFDADGCPVTVVGEVPDYDASEHMSPNLARKLSRFGRYGVSAAYLALLDAGIERSSIDPVRTAVVLGTCYGGAAEVCDARVEFEARGWRGVLPSVGPGAMANAVAAAVSMEFDVRGPVECLATSCATGAQAIARGYELIRMGLVDLVIAGASDAPVFPVALGSFATARALSTSADPLLASRPFDRDRDGFVISEGGAVVILESESRAAGRGARNYARMLGWGHSGDAHNLTQPRPDGDGAADAMRAALTMADVDPGGVGYIHAHATGTPQGDIAEANAITTVFGANAPPVSASKSVTGHMMGAAGAAGAAIAALALHTSTVPPTAGHRSVDERIDLDVVPNHPRSQQAQIAVANAFALGGINSSLVFGS